MYRYVTTLTIFIFGISLTLMAQREVRGHAYDKDTRKPMAGATILLYTAEKSVLTAQTTASESGDFVLKKIPPGNYHLTISFMGYTAATSSFTITEKTKILFIDLHNSGLTRNPINLSSINVKVNKPAFTVRKDTVEFSAGDFQTTENASLRNLLNKLPGITVDGDGNLSFQGTPIKTILVNGRPLFQDGSNANGDTKKITQTLLADLVDKVQVIDRKKTDGIADDSKNEKVINITVKKEYKKGVNGTTGAGYGTDKRYTAAANANMFRDNKQAVVMGYFNNINSSRGPSSTDENLNRAESMMGGISKKNSLNANLATELSSKVKLNANFMHLTQNMNNDQSLQRDNILPDSNFRYNSNTNAESKANMNNVFANLTVQPNEKNFISVDLMGSTQHNDYTSSNNYISLGGKNNDTINSGNTSNQEDRRNSSINVLTQYNHQFNPSWGSLSVSFNIEQNNTRDDQHNNTLNLLPDSGTQDTINQLVKSKLNVSRMTGRINYQYPLMPTLSMNISYKISGNQSSNNQGGFDFDNEKKGYDIINKDLTYNFKNNLTEHSVGAGLFLNRTKLQGQLNIIYSITDSKSNNYTTQNQFRQKINYISPNLNFMYKIDNYRSFDFRLNRETRVPHTELLLIPVVSTRNPLYVQLGNPDLKPTIYNSAALGYRSFSLNGLSFSTNFSFDMPNDAIAQSVYSDSIGRQITQPVNVDGNYNFGQDFTFGKRFSKSGLTLNYSVSYYCNRINSFINRVRSRTTDFNITQMVNAAWNYKKLLELEGFIGILYLSNRYSLQNNKLIDYTMYNMSLTAKVFLPGDISLGSSALYLNNTSQHQQFVVLNSWISKTFLKRKSLEVKIYAYDLTKKNQSLLTSQSITFIEQQRNSVLTQYFLGSVTYFFGKKPPAPKLPE